MDEADFDVYNILLYIGAIKQFLFLPISQHIFLYSISAIMISWVRICKPFKDL